VESDESGVVPCDLLFFVYQVYRWRGYHLVGGLLVVAVCYFVRGDVESGWVWECVDWLVVVLVSFDPYCFVGRSVWS
jgi:hypothetical protein